MNPLPLPSQKFDPALAHKLRAVAEEAEQLQALHPDQLEIIYQQNWFNLFVPTAFGGKGLSLPEVLQYEEAIAWIDGSLGWTVTLCAGANWFCGFLHPHLRTALFAEPRVCLAGSGNVGGNARAIGDGYKVSGNWDYATGSFAATAFTANCFIRNEEDPVQVDEPIVRSFVFLKDEVEVIHNWKRMGMIATGSNRFAVEEINIPLSRSFIIHPRHATLPDPVFQYPFLQLAETTLAANSSGMSHRFLELCRDKLLRLTVMNLLEKFDKQVQELSAERALFYDLVGRSWLSCASGEEIDAALLAKISSASKTFAWHCRQLVDAWYPYCGMEAADPSTEINRIWRNLHTASQHRLMLPDTP